MIRIFHVQPVALLILIVAFAQGFNCSCNHGVCDATGLSCVCDEGYVTFPDDAVPQCDQKRKSRLIAAILSGFLAEVGAARFYLGYNAYAAGQIIYYVLGLFCIAILAYAAGICMDGISTSNAVMMIGTFLWISFGFVWWAVELVFILDGTVKDANGSGLY